MKKGVATYNTFIPSSKLSPTILFICNKSGCFFNHEKTMYYRKYKIIVAIMYYISCYMFLFIINYIIVFLQQNMYISKYLELILTNWPYVNCILWFMWLIFSYMTSTIGLCVFQRVICGPLWIHVPTNEAFGLDSSNQ
jgi:hypothetical protein